MVPHSSTVAARALAVAMSARWVLLSPPPNMTISVPPRSMYLIEYSLSMADVRRQLLQGFGRVCLHGAPADMAKIAPCR
jgi:hypothetical protein